MNSYAICTERRACNVPARPGHDPPGLQVASLPHRYTEMLRPLYALLKGRPRKLAPLGPEELKSFKELVEAATRPLVLAVPQIGLRYSLHTDAWKY